MYTISGIKDSGLSNLWHYSENYLNIGQSSHEIVAVSGRLLKYATVNPHANWIHTALKVISYFSIILPLIALMICATYRAHYQFKQKNEPTKIFLVRHGQTDWNTRDLLQGSSDNPLNDKGIEQALDLAKSIAEKGIAFKAIYSSDLSRAYSTAEATAAKLNLSIHKNAAFREISFGAAEGITTTENIKLHGASEKELDAKYSDIKERWKYTGIPGAETNHQVFERASNAMKQIAEKHPGEPVLVFTHGRVIRVLTTLFSNNPDPYSHKIGNGLHCRIAFYRHT